MLDGSYVAVKTVGSKPYSKKKKILFFIFAQDCTANNHVVGLHGVPTYSVIKVKYFLFIGYTVTIWVLRKYSTCP